jgi:hypothetical protein
VLLGRRTKAVILAVILATVMGLLTWHTIWWHTNGTHEELYNAIGDDTWSTTKAVLYNLGLMAAAGLLLGLFSEQITNMFGYEVKKIDHFADESEAEPAPAPDLTAVRESALAEEAAEKVRGQTQ